MSNLADVSVNFNILSSPIYSSTLISKHGDHSNTADEIKISFHQQNIMNNTKSSPESHDLIKSKKNQNFTKNNNDYTEKYKDKRDNKPLKLKVIISNTDNQHDRVMNVVNDLSKVQSPIVEKNTYDFITTEKESGGNKVYRNMPIMGKTALLKKANIETDDSLIIYDLVTEKYHEVLNHYLDRSTQRRQRRESLDNYSDTIFSSPPIYTPMTLSSINTPGSMGPDEQTGFRFPLNYSTIRPEIKITPSQGTAINEVINDDGEVENTETTDKSNFNFIESTDDGNIETPVEEVSSWMSSNSTAVKSTTSCSDYDPTKFLENALGEITNLSFTNGDSPESVKDKKGSSSIGSSNLSDLISRASTLYTSPGPKTNTRKIRSFESTDHLPQICEDKRLSLNTNNSYLEYLMKELSLQNEIMFQISKALNYCRTTKKFESSVEHLEAEKILLVASCTKEALTKEIQNVEDDSYEKHDDSICYGEVTLTDMTFHPKRDHHTEGYRDFTEHFLVVATCASTVVASEIVTANQTGEVHVWKTFNFTNLAIDFEISICIFAMRVANKPHPNEDPKTTCPSPKKIFSQLKSDTRKYKVLSEVVNIKPSSFTLWGKCELRSGDLSKVKNNDVMTFKMYNTPLSSSLSGEFSLSINTDVKLINKFSGFLNIGTMGTDNEYGCTIWNRRWCALEGCMMKFWNYPSDEAATPLETINLRHCLVQNVRVAERSICPRPRTLMLPIKQNGAEIKYLLSADNFLSMEQWEKEINKVVCSLRVWNRIEV